MAIERQTECWTKACINYTGRSHCSFNCHDNLEDYTFLNEFCPMKTRNATIHDFGIFHGALESGIVEGTSILQKLLHCFVWGLQNLRFVHGWYYSCWWQVGWCGFLYLSLVMYLSYLKIIGLCQSNCCFFYTYWAKPIYQEILFLMIHFQFYCAIICCLFIYSVLSALLKWLVVFP